MTRPLDRPAAAVPAVRSLTAPDELRAGFAVFGQAMVGLDQRGLDAAELAEPGRAFGAYLPAGHAGEALVGAAAAYTSTLTVPGGATLPHAAVTGVGVLPTHRRRGILTALMRAQFADIAARGESVATLRASEAVIYSRFGYGIAGSHTPVRVDLRRTDIRPFPESGHVRLFDPDSPLRQRLHADTRQPGAITRYPAWWRSRELRDQQSAAHRYLAVHSTAGIDDGYLAYRAVPESDWFTNPDKTIRVTDIVAHNDGAYRDLWRYLLSIDLVDVVQIDSLSLDDPLPLLLTDPRAAQLGPTRDETWLRLIDVPRALAERSYRPGPSATIAVLDPQLPANQGNYRISADEVARTDEPAELTVGVGDLATVYLGGTRWWQLARTGRISAPPQVISRLDELFAADTAPFSGTHF